MAFFQRVLDSISRHVKDSNERLAEYIDGILNKNGLESFVSVKPNKDGYRLQIAGKYSPLYADVFLDDEDLVTGGTQIGKLKEGDIQQMATFLGIPEKEVAEKANKFADVIRFLIAHNHRPIDELGKVGDSVGDDLYSVISLLRSSREDQYVDLTVRGIPVTASFVHSVPNNSDMVDVLLSTAEGCKVPVGSFDVSGLAITDRILKAIFAKFGPAGSAETPKKDASAEMRIAEDVMHSVVSDLRSASDDQAIDLTIDGVDLSVSFSHPFPKDTNMVGVTVTPLGGSPINLGRYDVSGLAISHRILLDVVSSLSSPVTDSVADDLFMGRVSEDAGVMVLYIDDEYLHFVDNSGLNLKIAYKGKTAEDVAEDIRGGKAIKDSGTPAVKDSKGSDIEKIDKVLASVRKAHEATGKPSKKSIDLEIEGVPAKYSVKAYAEGAKKKIGVEIVYGKSGERKGFDYGWDALASHVYGDIVSTIQGSGAVKDSDTESIVSLIEAGVGEEGDFHNNPGEVWFTLPDSPSIWGKPAEVNLVLTDWDAASEDVEFNPEVHEVQAVVLYIHGGSGVVAVRWADPSLSDLMRIVTIYLRLSGRPFVSDVDVKEFIRTTGIGGGKIVDGCTPRKSRKQDSEGDGCSKDLLIYVGYSLKSLLSNREGSDVITEEIDGTPIALNLEYKRPDLVRVYLMVGNERISDRKHLGDFPEGSASDICDAVYKELKSRVKDAASPESALEPLSALVWDLRNDPAKKEGSATVDYLGSKVEFNIRRVHPTDSSLIEVSVKGDGSPVVLGKMDLDGLSLADRLYHRGLRALGLENKAVVDGCGKVKDDEQVTDISTVSLGDTLLVNPQLTTDPFNRRGEIGRVKAIVGDDVVVLRFADGTVGSYTVTSLMRPVSDMASK